MVSASHRRSEGSGLITAWDSEMFKKLERNNESFPCSLKTASSRQLFTGRTSSLRDAHAQQISCLKNLFFPRFFFKNLYDFSLTDFLSSFSPAKLAEKSNREIALRSVRRKCCTVPCYPPDPRWSPPTHPAMQGPHWRYRWHHSRHLSGTLRRWRRPSVCRKRHPGLPSWTGNPRLLYPTVFYVSFKLIQTWYGLSAVICCPYSWFV